jgi:putative ABC transport system permease protein
MAAVATSSRTLTGTSGGAEQIPSQSVTTQFFDVLGITLRITPIAGRTFLADDATPGSNVVVVSERLWKSHFGADAAFVGRSMRLDGQPFIVIGIVPADFQLLSTSELWTPFPLSRDLGLRSHFLQVVGRLTPGVSLEQARADMAAVAENRAREAPETNKGWGITIEPLQRAIVSPELRATSLVLGGVVGFVLLMACANVASLLLARGLARAQEIAVRAALGASRSRILRQLVTESIVLALIGGAAGLALSWAILRAAPAIVPPGTLPPSILVTFNVRVMIFAVIATLATGVLFGLAPAWHATRIPLAGAIGAGRTSTNRAALFRTALAVAEIAGAVLLLTSGVLLLRTLIALNSIDPGYRGDRVLTMSIALPFGRYTQDQALSFYQAVEREIAALPSVRVAAIGGDLPLDGSGLSQPFEIVGDRSPQAQRPLAHYQIVDARYFQALGIPVLQGRNFTEQDTGSTTQVCVVNEEFVRRYLNGLTPLGTLVTVSAMNLGSKPKPITRQIVGVIKQVKTELAEPENAVEIYVPLAQNPWYSASVIVQAGTDPMTLVPAIKAAVARVNKDQPVTRVRTMEEIANNSTSKPRFRAQLVGTFAALAVALAAVGLFGVLALSVQQRTREFGIRVALGARAGDVLRLVLTGCIRVTAAGIAIGVSASVALTRFLASLLFGVQPLDPVTLLVAPAVLGFVALIACAAPALRAAHIDPAVALRQE